MQSLKFAGQPYTKKSWLASADHALRP